MELMNYDCIIVGAGPAGIFAALEIVKKSKGKRVLLIEKGSDLPERDRKDIFSGWGGAGTYSDGKLNISREVGGFLNEYATPDELDALLSYADGLYVEFGAPEELKGYDAGAVAEIGRDAARAGLKFMPFPIRHIGTDGCLGLLKNLRQWLEGKVDMVFGQEVAEVMVDSGRVTGVRTAAGAEHRSGFVVLSPGRIGARWLQDVARETGLATTNNPVDIGVRVEVPASVLARVTDSVHEAKLTYRSRKFDDPVRTFCMNPYGVVVKERNAGFCTVNGHSYSVRKSDNTNFALLVSSVFTEPFKEPIAYGEYIARLANLLGDGIIVQRLGDLLHGRRSTVERIRRGGLTPTLKDATPGDLSFVLPYRHLSDIVEMLEVLDGFAPGINSPSTLLYGVEVKFYSLRPRLTGSLETEVQNLFAAGDGAGVTRGILQASVSGIIAAREILKRL